MRIVLIGSGNVATALGKRLFNAGHLLLQVYSKTFAHAQTLAKELSASAVLSPLDIARNADLYLVAISDDELYSLDSWMAHTGGLLVHTAGSVSKDVLQNMGDPYGVLYPLQTLKKDADTGEDVPLLVDASDDDAQAKLLALALTISGNVRHAGDAERKKLHLAAVIVNNFSNHLFTLTEDYCRQEQIEFRMLLPLITEGVKRLLVSSPAMLQTGPAARRDMTTIAGHRELLQHHQELLKIYDLFTGSITTYYRDISGGRL